MKYHRGKRGLGKRTVVVTSEHGCSEVRRLITKELLPLVVSLKSVADEINERNRQAGRDLEIIAQAVSRLHVPLDEKEP